MLALSYGLNRPNQFLAAGIFRQVGKSTRVQRPVNIFTSFVVTQDQNASASINLSDRLNRFEAGNVWQSQIHDRHMGSVRPVKRNGLTAFVRFSDDLHVAAGIN